MFMAACAQNVETAHMSVMEGRGAACPHPDIARPDTSCGRVGARAPVGRPCGLDPELAPVPRAGSSSTSWRALSRRVATGGSTCLQVHPRLPPVPPPRHHGQRMSPHLALHPPCLLTQLICLSAGPRVPARQSWCIGWETRRHPLNACGDEMPPTLCAEALAPSMWVSVVGGRQGRYFWGPGCRGAMGGGWGG